MGHRGPAEAGIGHRASVWSARLHVTASEGQTQTHGVAPRRLGAALRRAGAGQRGRVAAAAGDGGQVHAHGADAGAQQGRAGAPGGAAALQAADALAEQAVRNQEVADDRVVRDLSGPRVGSLVGGLGCSGKSGELVAKRGAEALPATDAMHEQRIPTGVPSLSLTKPAAQRDTCVLP